MLIVSLTKKVEFQALHPEEFIPCAYYADLILSTKFHADESYAGVDSCAARFAHFDSL